jgi:hypothetical protein
MPTDDDVNFRDRPDDERKLLVTLMASPFNLEFRHARAAVRNGTARMIIESGEAVRKQMLANIETELLAEFAAMNPKFGGVLPVTVEGKDALIRALAERCNAQAAIMSRTAERSATDPRLSPFQKWHSALSEDDKYHYQTARDKINAAHVRDPNKATSDGFTYEEMGFTEDEVRVFKSRPKPERIPGGFIANPTGKDGKPLHPVDAAGEKAAEWLAGEIDKEHQKTISGPFARMTEASTEGQSEAKSAQSSEPCDCGEKTPEECEKVYKCHTEPHVRFFVCLKCGGAFATEPHCFAAQCPCDAAYLDTARKPVMSEAAFEVTALVASGKLSVAPVGEEDRRAVLLAVHNRTKRNIPQRSAVQSSRLAGQGIRDGTQAAFEYLGKAAEAGARVLFHTHYHTRACGVERTANGDFLKKEATGDARFTAQVIVRDQKNEADGSLLFYPVHGCARCGKDHVQPLAFWKLTRPVWQPVEGTACGSVLVATHFGYCPDTGEPIMMVSDTGVDADGLALASAAATQFTKPAAGGKVEAMRSIGGNDPIPAARSNDARPVLGTSHPPEYEAGWFAAHNGDASTTNPHPSGSEAAGEWNRGFRDRSES